MTVRPEPSALGSSADGCSVRKAAPVHRGERGLWAVVALTAAMMVVEIVVGYATNSMALTADGFHMATHVGALGMAAAAYAFARRFADHEAFAFGTGKVQALAGYTSALLLGVVAISMVYESVQRLLEPAAIDFGTSLPVAVVGLVVNLASVWLLHPQDHGHDHDHHHSHDHDHDQDDHDHAHHGHGHDHNHRAALTHVIADALTSALAIVALFAGKLFGIVWLDAVTGIVGGLVILRWSYDLCRHASFELLDAAPSSEAEQRIRNTLLAQADVAVSDLHVWSLGGGRRSCVVTLCSPEPKSVDHYRQLILAACPLAHLTVEIRQNRE